MTRRNGRKQEKTARAFRPRRKAFRGRYHQLTRAYTPDTSEEVRAVSLLPYGKSCTTLSPSSFSMQTRFAGLCMEYERFCSFRLDGLRNICGSKSKNHSEIQSRQVRSSFAGAEMRSGNERHAADTWCLGKGFEAAWTHFHPSKPCVSLSTDGTKVRGDSPWRLTKHISTA